jgi:hypothetical protein
MTTQATVIGGISDFNPETQSPRIKKSLREMICESQTETDVQTALEIGKSYTKANHKTMKSWVRAASDRIEELRKIRLE